MPFFQYRHCKPTEWWRKVSLEAAGRQEAFVKWKARGCGRESRRRKPGAGWGKRAGVAGIAFVAFAFQEIGKNLGPFDGRFYAVLSSLLAAGVPLSRALGFFTRGFGPTTTAKWRKIHDLVSMACR